ncbi:unnamed protein product [Spirodela intermedia]|uniref:Uncharacterized protein n=1 Tax=Spirodela intermedia TaxID=51605 RepID=A0A7I8KL73_SPIIN|nr:unnamed protein product [Spirodela intermedia]
MEERDIVRQFLRVMPSKFDALTFLDEMIGSLTVHELRLKECESREEE